MHPAALDEEALLATCAVRRQRRSGPGGQHRNKVETAVTIIHVPTDVRGEASERRSQEKNRRQALFRLRINLALEVRQASELNAYAPSVIWSRRCRDGKLVINPQHNDFPTMLAEALDVLASCQMDVASAASRLGCSPSQLVKLLRREPRALALVNRQRQAANKPAYR